MLLFPIVTLRTHVTSPHLTSQTSSDPPITLPGKNLWRLTSLDGPRNGSRRVSTNHNPDRVLDRFPEHRKRVLELCLSDAAFAEACAEYEEICRTLQQTEAEGQGNSGIARELRRLREDLAEDLSETLIDDHAKQA